MQTIILTAVGLVVASAGAHAADTAQCNSKPFTLQKPAQPAAKPIVKEASKPAPKPTKVASAPSKPKPKPIADCDKPKG